MPAKQRTNITSPATMGQIILYQSEDGRTKLDVRLEGQTVWLSQKQLTELRRTEDQHLESDFDRAIQQLPPPPEAP